MIQRDLTQSPIIRSVVRNRWPQFILRVIALAGFVFAILSAFLGTPVGSHNFGIVFVWIAWWALLMLIAVPLLGRGWCSICPIPVPGEWLQNGAVLGPQKKGFSLGYRWPRRFRSIWLQNIAFVIVALFSTVVLTQPNITGVVLLTFLLAAIGLSVIFERRAFCRYVCPVGGFIGLYSQVAPIEVRVKEPEVCASHKEKTCYTGSADGFGCPWDVYPLALKKNTYCGTCVECLRTCPHDNIAINLRAFGADLRKPAGRRLDEAFKALIMLGTALIYCVVLLGPWGVLKSAAYSIGTAPWLMYAVSFLSFILVLLPASFLAAVAIGRRLSNSKETMRKSFVAYAYALVPLGLAMWIAFSLSFVFANLSYVWQALSDPFGRGWNLFGTAQVEWTPYFMSLVPMLQVGVLLGGLVWASITARRIAAEKHTGRRVILQAAPVMSFCLIVMIAMLGLLIG